MGKVSRPAAGVEQFPLALLHPQGTLGIAHPQRLLEQPGRADAGLQAALPIVEQEQLFVGRAIVVEPLTPPPFAVLAHLDRGESAGAMIVQIVVEIGHIEALHPTGMRGPDRCVSDVLAHHRAVLALYQSIVGAAIGPRLGELRDLTATP